MITRGFTLIELVIVIGIIALLATTVILVINPVKIFQEARDSQRVADLGQLNSALGLYLATAPSVTLDGGGGTCASNCYVLTGGNATAGCGGRYGTKVAVANPSQNVNGTGWIPVNLTEVSSGSPLSAVPRDPKNGATYYYSYACDNTGGNQNYELGAKMESARYSAGGADDQETTDGGNSASSLEIGNAPGLGL
jgi:prepilin-type N-terminal cleavage/methylation domain-containing protein